jgi:hypothetical protein
MKKSVKKMALTRETVRQLTHESNVVVGGIPTDVCTQSFCSVNGCSQSSCPRVSCDPC